MIVIDTKQKMKDAILRGAELLRYQGQLELANEFEKWVPPRFPVGGADLKSEGVPSNKTKLFFNDLLLYSLICCFSWQSHEYGYSTVTKQMERKRLPN